MDNLFEVAFATRNSQSIMSGCTSYYNRFYATVVENDVERIIISKSDANYLVVGSTVSIGNATALSGNNPTDDRSNTVFRNGWRKGHSRYSIWHNFPGRFAPGNGSFFNEICLGIR